MISLEGYKVVTVEGTDMVNAEKPLFAFQLKHEVSHVTSMFVKNRAKYTLVEEREYIFIIRNQRNIARLAVFRQRADQIRCGKQEV